MYCQSVNLIYAGPVTQYPRISFSLVSTFHSVCPGTRNNNDISSRCGPLIVRSNSVLFSSCKKTLQKLAPHNKVVSCARYVKFGTQVFRYGCVSVSFILTINSEKFPKLCKLTVCIGQCCFLGDRNRILKCYLLLLCSWKSKLALGYKEK